MINLANALRLLGDDTRLRILRLVAREPLNVSEITSILGLAQSGISRHLSLLRKAGLVEEQREGVWTYYQISPGLIAVNGAGSVGRGDTGNGPAGDRTAGNGHAGDSEAADPEVREVWQYVKARFGSVPDSYHDLGRLAEVLRRRENFGGGLNEKLLEPGQSWFAWSRALHFLLPAVEAIDLGCGDGTISVEISRFAKRVVGIDVNPRALLAARKRAEREHRDNIVFKEDRIESLQEPSGSYDLAVFSQSLHHIQEPERGLKEAARVLKPGGRLVVVDLAPHTERWVQAKLGHAHLGFEPESLTAMLGRCGLQQVQIEPVNQRRGEVFRVLVATGLKPRGKS